MPSEPTLDELKEKLASEEELYAELLQKLDALAQIRAPFDQDASIQQLLAELNQSEALVEPTSRHEPGARGLWRRLVMRAAAPDFALLHQALDRQRAFHSSLVQFLNRFAETTNRAAAAQAEFSSALVGFSQRIDRLADAKDRLYASLGNTRADLLLETMDKRLETIRLGLGRLVERLEGMDTSLTLARAELKGLDSRVEGRRPAAPTVAPLEPGFEEEHYLAFEERFRGSTDAIRERLTGYVGLFEERAPVLELGCGRGEFLELMRRADIEAAGIDGNAEMVAACRDQGLDASEGDALGHLEQRPADSAGGIFAAQLIEHLPPVALRRFVDACYRVVRPGGCVVLETVNPESVVALVGFYRDLTHQKPLHAETLDFLLRAAGFKDVELRTTSPVSERARLLRVDDSLPVAQTLNQNFEKLNQLLFGDQDYAAIATK